MLMLSLFEHPAGKEVLDYLRSITLNRVNGPEASDMALRHHEGMRQLFQIIVNRIERGRAQ